MNVPEKPDTLDDSRNQPGPTVYPSISTAVIVLMMMSVLSTATADRPYSAIMSLKNYLRATMTTERMPGLALMHVHKDIELDAECIMHQFSHQKSRRIALLFSI